MARGRSGSGSGPSSSMPTTTPPAVTATLAGAIPPGADVWYIPGNPAPPAYGRRAAKNLVQAGLGGIGLGIGWLALVIGTFFVVTVGLLGLLIGVLYLLNMAAGTV